MPNIGAGGCPGGMNLSFLNFMNLWLRHIIALSILGLLPPAFGKPTPDQFRFEISSHRERILNLGLKVSEKFLGDFPVLSGLESEQRQKLLKLYLSMHDLPKLMDLSQLKTYSYKDSKTIFSHLYDVYGGKLETQPQFIQDLNDIEFQLKESVMSQEMAFMPLSYQKSLMKEFKQIEDIVDFTDTKISRGRELGFVAKPYSAAALFMSKQMPVSARISTWIEETQYKSALRACGKVFGD